ncbi:cytidylate kinase family protein [Candidatus Uhrbacteria bacterium]|nr:cytidylate kinase family protein [Candidatus Uhrbacteria bacterium]
MIISISGVPGSGKTSVAKILAERLGMNFYSMGGLRGKMAVERGLTIDELNALGEREAFTDNDVDDYQKKLGQIEDNFVIEGRLSWHFIPRSFKIFLTCDPHEAARRIYEARRQTDDRTDEPAYQHVKATEEAVRKRVASDALRYQKYYGLDVHDPSQYDLVLDTTSMKGPEETTEAILSKLPSAA